MQNPEPSRRIKEWTDDELIAQYRVLKAEVVDNGERVPPDMDRPGELVEDEIKRRGLFPDREDIVPDPFDPSADHPVEGDTRRD